MELSVTVAQAVAVKAALTATAVVLYERNGTDPTRVGVVSILDTRAGQLVLRWAVEGEAPLVTAFLTQLPAAIEVASITG